MPYTLSIKGRPGHIEKRRVSKKTGNVSIGWVQVIRQSPKHHWSEIARCKKKDEEAVWAAVNSIGAPAKFKTPVTKCLIKVVIYVTTHRQRDNDNMVVTLKGVLDGLVRAGVIADDNTDVIGVPIIHVVNIPNPRAQSYYYEITVYPMETDN